MTIPSNEEIKAELTAAKEALDDAESNMSENRFRTAISRAYYAIFHAARAVVWTRGLAPKTHKGLARQFGQYVVRARLTDKRFNKILKDAADERELADYNAMTGSFEKEDVVSLVSEAREFVEEMGKVLNKR